MFKKIGEKLAQAGQAQADAMNNVNETVVRLFSENVEGAAEYVYGVGQIEVESGGVGNVAAKALLNVAFVESSDYIIGVNVAQQRLAVLSIVDDKVVDTHILEKGSYQLSKESKAVDELIGLFGRTGRSIARNSREDRYGRERFNLKTDDFKLRLLVGSYMTEGTNYPYDNGPLLQAAKDLIKALKSK